MNCKVGSSTIRGKIDCPPNKSYTHRGIFLAALAGRGSSVENVLFSEDTESTIRACESFGARFCQTDSSVDVVKGIGEEKIEDTVDAGNSGTTIRIAIALASTLSKKTTLTGDDSLKKRPMQPLLESLKELGATCHSNDGKPPVHIEGTIKGGKTSIPGDVSSQFISALLICAPLTEEGITLTIQKEMVSKPYLDATLATMRMFGITAQVIEPYKKYYVKPQKYTPTKFVVPSDFSSLALLLAAAVLVGDNELEVKIKQDDLPQGDIRFISILEELGVKTSFREGTVSVKHEDILLRGGKFDLSDNPDLLPPLAILSLKSSLPIEIFNVKHARIKETDRISILARELSKTGLEVSEKEDGLVLTKKEKIHGAELDPAKDHRLFMAFCIMGMYVGNCTVKDAESVSVSYPGFVSDMKRIGANIILDKH